MQSSLVVFDVLEVVNTVDSSFREGMTTRRIPPLPPLAADVTGIEDGHDANGELTNLSIGRREDEDGNATDDVVVSAPTSIGMEGEDGTPDAESCLEDGILLGSGTS
jgi:hypothetical protein